MESEPEHIKYLRLKREQAIKVQQTETSTTGQTPQQKLTSLIQSKVSPVLKIIDEVGQD